MESTTRLRLHDRVSFIGLFFLMVAWIFAAPLIGQTTWGLFVLRAVFFVILLVGVEAAVRRRVVAAVLGAAVVILFVLAEFVTDEINAFVAIYLFVLVMIVVLGLSRRVYSAPRVTMDTVFGAIVAYVLIGLGFSELYTLLDRLDPNSFAGSGVLDERSPIDFFYFSITTLTTLGYGDITPRTDTARTYAVMEAFLGQIYLVVLVARLVALQVTHSQMDADD